MQGKAGRPGQQTGQGGQGRHPSVVFSYKQGKAGQPGQTPARCFQLQTRQKDLVDQKKIFRPWTAQNLFFFVLTKTTFFFF
jgi:hypothetical protein